METAERAIFAEECRGHAGKLALGAPAGALFWFILLRLFTGELLVGFPLCILALGLILSAVVGWGPQAVGFSVWKFWNLLVAVIDRIITGVVCLVLFFGLITPVALALRLLRKSPLRITEKPDKSSQWKPPVSANNSPTRFLKQF